MSNFCNDSSVFQIMRFAVILLCIQLGYGYPSGAPAHACNSMIPQHDVASQQCQAKYLIQSDKSEFHANDIIRITIRGLTSNDHFKGFLLTAKSTNNQQIIGTWSVANSSMKTVSCNEIENTAVSHSSADHKSQIQALWHAPSTISEQTVVIKATIVKSYDEVYVDCFNLTLKAKQQPSQIISPPDQSILESDAKQISTQSNANVTWTYSGTTVTVTMIIEQVSMGEWRAIGFSPDEYMGNEYIFICQVSSAGDALLRRMHTKKGKQPPSITTTNVTVIHAVYENGHSTCQFSFETTAEQVDGEPAPIVTGTNYHILFAAGLLRAGNAVAKHTQTFETPLTYQLQNSETIRFDELFTTTTMSGDTSSLSTDSAMTTTTAASHSDVSVDIRWTYKNGVTHVKMQIHNLRASQWCALGLSLDDAMGQDHVFSCGYLPDSTILLRHFVNPDGHSRPVLANTGVHFNITRQKLENGKVDCDFTLSNFAGTKRSSRQANVPALSPTAIYFPLIAMGNLDGSNNMMRHAATGRRVLPQKVSLNRQETISYNVQSTTISTNLMKAHGIIMIFTWIVLVSTGILIARFFKVAWSDRKICGKAVWFAIHRTLMSTAALLTLVAFVLILVYKKGQWTSKINQREFVHSIIGILVISFATIQPFMALFRCNPSDKYRFIFNYAHAIVGSSAFILSIVAMFLALFFTQFEFELKKEWAILVAWACWLPVIFVTFEIIEIYFRKSVVPIDVPNTFDLDEDHHHHTATKMNPMAMKNNPYQDRIKVLCLLLHLLVAVGLSLALMVLIGKS